MLHSAASDLGLHYLLRPLCRDTFGKYGTGKAFPIVLDKRLFSTTKKKKNQSTESADGGGCLKFYRPLELIGYLRRNLKKKKKKKKATHK